MSRIRRSLKTVQGDVTINEGDVVVTDNTKGVVLTQPDSDLKRVKCVEDAGQDVLEIEDA